ncbi:ATP-dependent zinc metalloprotease FtsH [Desulfogranum mediterraneum]|uniref:ATP-dependent zinc metalloprotease FtsH n=1 Tax=Desulfogranum mediterraneum TaxID=160661 RepID=UPI00041CE5C6|nr:ATP-dependent zinc metalloprotease FtsH [Desulfogranum mediterraneum]
MKNQIQLGLLIITLAAFLLLGYNVYLRETTPPTQSYSTFLLELRQGNIAKVHLRGAEITGTDRIGRAFSSYSPDLGGLLPLLQEQEVEISAEPAAETGTITFFKVLLPISILYALWLIFHRRKLGQRSGLGLGERSRFTPVHSQRVTFADVAGIAEAKVELQEIIEFLKLPEKYSKLGAKLPKGVLLQGPPGTGKTLLAKAIAGEASVSFFSLGGSDFVEMFVGVGASRVRELFAEAKKSAPCIIFIDEIDAIGGKRSGNASSGASDEREQTLNALLVEMDGFSSDEVVIVVAATNRPDVLDPALLRPGRFDRQITIGLPDLKGRSKILQVHAQNVAVDPETDLTTIARSIPGFSGADIANLVNEAALMAGRHNKASIEMDDFEEAKDKIIMGIARKSIVVSEQDRRITAYHEAGHAIVGLMLDETDPLHKITIIPRGRAMGVTQQLPLDDRHTYSQTYLLNRIKTLLGGRAAESLVFNRLTTGASNDINIATDIASRIVCEWGMSEAIGPVAFRHEQEGFLQEGGQFKPYSEMTAQRLDQEVNRILHDCYETTYELLNQHNKFLHKFAEVLLLNETMDAEEADIVFRSYLREQEMERRLCGIRSEHPTP